MSQIAAGDITSDFEDLSQPPPRSKFRLRFSLLALFTFVTLVCLALAWLVQPKIVVATALFEVARVQPTLMGDASSVRFDQREFEIFKNTQRAKLMSHYVVNAALRRPGIAWLPILTSKQDQAAWLQEHLEVEYPGDGEILAIQLGGPESHRDDLVQIVDAVAKAYGEEVIYDQKARLLGERDLRAKALQRLTKELQERTQLLNDITAESGENAKDSVELKLRRYELDVLLEHIQDLRRRVERDNLEASSPSRIRQVQPAVVGPE